MNQKPLSLKNKPLVSSTVPVVSSAVVTRKRKYEVSIADLRQEMNPQTKTQQQKPPPEPIAQPVKAKKPKPELPPVIPRKERVAVCLAALQEIWPKLFNESEIVLWEIGIRNKLYDGMKHKHSRSLIADTLAHWKKQHPAYREQLKTAGNPRYGLDGTVTMVVTEDQAKIALKPKDQPRED